MANTEKLKEVDLDFEKLFNKEQKKTFNRFKYSVNCKTIIAMHIVRDGCDSTMHTIEINKNEITSCSFMAALYQKSESINFKESKIIESKPIIKLDDAIEFWENIIKE